MKVLESGGPLEQPLPNPVQQRQDVRLVFSALSTEPGSPRRIGMALSNESKWITVDGAQEVPSPCRWFLVVP